MKQQKYDGNHPMQPLCPRKQPWLSSQTIGSRPAAMARSFSNPHIAPQLSVEDLLLLRQRIADRASIKLEKLHSAVDTRRHDRRLQRQKSSGDDAGRKVKALQEVEDLKRSTH